MSEITQGIFRLVLKVAEVSLPSREGIPPCPIYKVGDEIVIEPVIYAREGRYRYDSEGKDTCDIVWKINGKVCKEIISQLMPLAFSHFVGADLPWMPDKSLVGFSCPDMERRVRFSGKRELLYNSPTKWYESIQKQKNRT